jgi:hypothetical protein
MMTMTPSTVRTGLLEALPQGCVFDGEIVCLILVALRKPIFLFLAGRCIKNTDCAEEAEGAPQGFDSRASDRADRRAHRAKSARHRRSDQ